MKRASFLVLSSLLLTFTFAPISSAVVPKSGATCSKIGQTIEYKGMRYTCIKSGAKKVWNKGVTIKATPTPTKSATVSATASATTSASPSSSSSVKEFTLAQVRANNSAASCWTIIEGDVYDLTKWIEQHPGGSGVIKGLCGADGTKSFENQHGGSGKVTRQLTQFYIGRLKA